MTHAEMHQRINDLYVQATRIPNEAFLLTEVRDYGNTHWEVEITVAKLPSSYCTVSQVCVNNGLMRDTFDEARLLECVNSELKCQPA